MYVLATNEHAAVNYKPAAFVPVSFALFLYLDAHPTGV